MASFDRTEALTDDIQTDLKLRELDAALAAKCRLP
jgi:hypothetical protein